MSRSGLAKLIAAVALVAALLILAFGRRGTDGPVTLHLSGPTMGTQYNVKIVAERTPTDVERTVIERAVAFALERVNATMSRYRDDSDIERFNRHRGPEPFSVAPEVARVVAVAQQISTESQGAFDVTVGPLVRLWGFDAKRGLATAPSPERIESMRRRVGYAALFPDTAKHTLRKTVPALDVDLSAIAKGYGVDRVGLALEALGHRDYMVEIGGEVRARGRRMDGARWRIAVEKPVPHERVLHGVVELEDRSMATSGDYRNFYDLDGRRMSHTIDPRTGRPVAHALASVTVLHERCTEADAYATALNVLGPDDGFALATQLGLAALFTAREPSGATTTQAGDAPGLVVRATPTFPKLLPAADRAARRPEPN